MQWYNFLDSIKDGAFRPKVGMLKFSKEDKEQIISAKVFIFKVDENTVVNAYKSPDDLIEAFKSIPFDTVWVEISNHNIGELLLGVYLHKTETKMSILGLMKIDGKNVIMDIAHCGSKQYTPIVQAITTLFSSLNDKKTGSYNPRKSIKINLNGEKTHHRVSEVIVVSNKKYFSTDTIENKKIDWSHRFDVRGHWAFYKNKNTVGHDPSGNIIFGKTWRKPYIKGNESLPFIKKTRVVNQPLVHNREETCD